jgi:hypothetical protein
MTEIAVDGAGMESLFEKVITGVDAIDSALVKIPTAPDGGIASEFIGFTMAAAAEAAGLDADSFRALVAIARDVLLDLHDNDAAAAEEFRTLRDQVEADS